MSSVVRNVTLHILARDLLIPSTFMKSSFLDRRVTGEITPVNFKKIQTTELNELWHIVSYYTLVFCPVC